MSEEAKKRTSNYTYIVECNDGTLYTGWTTDLDRRVAAHNSKCGAKYTRSRTPVKLVYYEEHNTKEEAMSREYHIKRLSRKEKLSLIRTFATKNDTTSASQ